MKIGLFFGSFNPIHTGHLIIANHAINETNLDQVWFVVSPQNPLKGSASLLNEFSRLHLVRLAIDGVSYLRVSNIEFSLPKPSYTVDSMAYFNEKYPEHVFSILLGSDGFQNLNSWKNYEALIFNYRFYIYIRPGFNISLTHGAMIHVLKAPLLEISSTYIRKLIKTNKSIRFLVPDIVKEEIEACGYYRKLLE